MVDTHALQAAVAQACSGATMFIGDLADRSTWGAVWPDSATDAQKTAVAEIVSGWVDPIPVPQEVTNWQARAALSDQPATDGKSANLLAQIDAAVHGSGDAKIIAAWEYGNTFLRGSSFVTSMAAALGLSSQQVDALFAAAAAET